MEVAKQFPVGFFDVSHLAHPQHTNAFRQWYLIFNLPIEVTIKDTISFSWWSCNFSMMDHFSGIPIL